MKKQVVLGLALMIGSFSFAQKKELKTAEKAIKSGNFADAKSAISSAEALMSAMDDKLKAKFYFLKGQALYANGAVSDDDVTTVISSFEKLDELESNSGKKVYGPKAGALKLEMLNNLITGASTALESKNYLASSSKFQKAYNISKGDTLYLYNAATVLVMGKDFDSALPIYNQLFELGYTGISTQFMATDKESGEEQAFPSATVRDISVKSGSHIKPRDAKSGSKVGEIAKNIALIYIEQGENEKALAAIDRAKMANPNDVNLILSEANAYYKMGDKDKYKALIKEALEIDPNNVDLVFNLGVFASEEKDYESAEAYYTKALELDPEYTNAYMNMAAMVLDQEQDIIDEMNGLGTSSADNKKYDELKAKREGLYRKAVPYLETVLEKDSKSIGAARTLMNIYSALGEDDKFKAMKAKIEELEGGN